MMFSDESCTESVCGTQSSWKNEALDLSFSYESLAKAFDHPELFYPKKWGSLKIDTCQP